MKIAILGTGAYGLALSTVMYRNNNEITMWSKLKEEVDNLNKNRKNTSLNIEIPKDIIITNNLKECIEDKDIIFIAIPTQYINDLAKELKKYIKKNQHICIASKGIENGTYLFINDILRKYIKENNIAAISGPSFAIDIINKDVIGLSLGCTSKKTATIIKKCLENDHVRLRYTRDIKGIEICGAIKNVIAIASGILDGMGLSESTKAMFITESLHDIKQLIKILGGSKKTITSYAGIGDLLLTCTSTKSRNFTLGYMIGKKMDKVIIDEYIKNTTIEGLYTLKSIYGLLNKKSEKLPIITLIYNIIYKNEDPILLKKFLITKE